MFSRKQEEGVTPLAHASLSGGNGRGDQSVIAMPERELKRTQPAGSVVEVPAVIPDNARAKPPQRNHINIKGLAIFAVVLATVLLLGSGGYQWHSYATAHESTDDAYTAGHMHAISSRISDTVEKVLVDDNEHVKKGQVLFLLDPRDYQVRVDAALAALQTAQNQAEAARVSIDLADTTANGKSIEAAGQVSNSESNIRRSVAAIVEARSAIPQVKAELAAAQAEELRAATDFERYKMLAEQGAVSVQQKDQSLRDYKVAQEAAKAREQMVRQAESRLHQAEESAAAARAQLVQSKGMLEQARATHLQTMVDSSQFEVARSRIAQAQADLKQAQLELSYTRVVAPVDGRVGKKTVEEGQRVQPGQQLMNIVSDDIWIVANFKETQLERMRQRQAVEVKIDSFPDHKFKGVVDSVSPGSGASFALLPPDNATGNFTKIVQRVPVKIRLNGESLTGYEQLLVPGMSVVVNVNTGR